MHHALAVILLVAATISGGCCISLNSRLEKWWCTAPGFTAIHPGLCHRYINCVINADGTLTARLEKCPPGQMFDSETLNCRTAAGTESGRYRRLVKREDPVTPAPTTVPVKECHGSMFSCADCHSIRVCSLSDGTTYEFKHDTNCTGATPFCDQANVGCVSTLPEGCDSGFKCLKVGIFPDANDCTIYHNCYLDPTTKKLRDAQAYCDPGNVFSGSIEDCKFKISPTDCHTARCTANANGFYPFPSEPKYYILCDSGLAEYIASCPAGQEYTANGKCNVVCRKVGKIADPQSCLMYYDCAATTASGPPYKMTSKKCLPGTKFDAPTEKCVPGTAC